VQVWRYLDRAIAVANETPRRIAPLQGDRVDFPEAESDSDSDADSEPAREPAAAVPWNGALKAGDYATFRGGDDGAVVKITEAPGREGGEAVIEHVNIWKRRTGRVELSRLEYFDLEGKPGSRAGPGPAHLRVGANVKNIKFNDGLYDGQITAIKESHYVVQFGDGEEHLIPKRLIEDSRARKRPRAEASTPAKKAMKKARK